MQLTDFKALTFDVYGTLIDWETGMINGLKPLTDRISPALPRTDDNYELWEPETTPP